MTVRALLLSPAVGSALRAARFDDDSPPDERGVAQARAAAGAVPRASRQLSAPSLRCRETAAALGLSPEPAPALADLAVGRWRGRSLDELAVAEPEAVAAWLADPGAAPHGGESLLALVERVGAWLDGLGGQDDGDGRVLAVAEPAVIRAAVVHALALPPQAFWRLDVRPLTLTTLSGRAGRWNLRCGEALGSTV
ncbi:histidine phosphatase family protein [Streptomyces hesseae]|uniref:Histidine phosphatase family protein n=1 Tax=Streptomyces hesseae TaxID=3075519 RepID=A0ABU2SG68_9ACTN|nr:histidine phosphatase family protein [Streptomyces sp. DSM 40473]MDT0447972.1 histidine phosphatase family protein [Streptomyces sp. DSM 40473]